MPDFISEVSTFAVLQASASSWDPYVGSNMVVLISQMDSAYTGVKIAVHWSDKDKSGTIGLANITQKILTFSPEVFRKLKDINAAKKLPIEYLMETLQMTASHEIGHFQGLSSHSKRCVDVLSYYAVGGKNAICVAMCPCLKTSMSTDPHCQLPAILKGVGWPTNPDL